MAMRSKILDFEDFLMQQPGAIVGDSEAIPLEHFFADGMYIRKIFIPKDTVCVGKIHKGTHPVFLMSGVIDIVSEENGIQRMTAPQMIISSDGTKRVGHAIEDVVWIEVYATDETDLEKIEDEVIAKSYEELPSKEVLCLG